MPKSISEIDSSGVLEKLLCKQRERGGRVCWQNLHKTFSKQMGLSLWEIFWALMILNHFDLILSFFVNGTCWLCFKQRDNVITQVQIRFIPATQQLWLKSCCRGFFLEKFYILSDLRKRTIAGGFLSAFCRKLISPKMPNTHVPNSNGTFIILKPKR